MEQQGKTPTEEMNAVVLEAAKIIVEEMKTAQLRIDILTETVEALERLGHTLSELQIRPEPYDFKAAMGKIMATPYGTGIGTGEKKQ